VFQLRLLIIEACLCKYVKKLRSRIGETKEGRDGESVERIEEGISTRTQKEKKGHDVNNRRNRDR
jgi:hypothetical protein